MPKRQTGDADVPAARREFAQRLRLLRVPRGFRTARSLAQALAIDENRYTRYERAEVEPDLTMIRRICEVLAVQPNQLLAYGPEEAGHAARSNGASASRSGTNGRGRARSEPPAGASAQLQLGVPKAAWALAESVIAMRHGSLTNGAAADARDTPLAAVSETSALYRDIMVQPFEAIAELLRDPAIAKLAPDTAGHLERSIDSLVHHLKQSPGAHR